MLESVRHTNNMNPTLKTGLKKNTTMTKTALLRKAINSKGYMAQRLSRMSEESMYYVDYANKTQNARLRRAFFDIAEMYNKRYLWYFNKTRQ
jgi:hypothetical protein